jgi:hypothetical protein
MARPTSREELKQYCLRRLGAPVIDINVDDELDIFIPPFSEDPL